MTDGATDVRTLLRDAETNWTALEDADILMEESRNDGGWLRPWRSLAWWADDHSESLMDFAGHLPYMQRIAYIARSKWDTI